YPAALQAFREALEISRTIHQFVQYELMNCASALGELGEYSEAEGLLHEAAGMKATPPGEVERIIATIRLSQKRYGEVLSETQRMMGVRPPLTAAALAEANILRCRAFLSTGSPDRARTACEAALQPAAAK